MTNFELLYWEHGKTQKHRLGNFHTHHFWQLEFITAGAPLLEHKAGKGLKLNDGDYIIIPAGYRHRFNYYKRPKESWSFKFHYNISQANLEPFFIKNDIEADIIHDAILKLATQKIDLTESIVAQNLIKSLVMKYFPESVTASPKDPKLMTQVKELIIKSETGNVDVTFLATSLGYSRDYLSALFKQTTGIPLKKFIDQERLKLAKRLLIYSELSIGEIAAKLAFPDPFTFSHFFKRLHGQSPTNFCKIEQE